MNVLHLYQKAFISNKLKKIITEKNLLTDDVDITLQICYNMEIKKFPFDITLLKRFISLSNNMDDIYMEPINVSTLKYNLRIEVGPRLNFCTPYSTNVICILKSFGFDFINRFEMSHIYEFSSDHDENLLSKKVDIAQLLHDKMTQMIYTDPIQSFDLNIEKMSFFTVDVLGEGIQALENINKSMGLALDDWDIQYYTHLFADVMQRNPTNVECFDLAQSNSEHCRHFFFKGQMTVDNEEMKSSLFDMVMDTLNHSNPNNVVAFSDNSSAIKGFCVPMLHVTDPSQTSIYKMMDSFQNVCFTAETHNFPTGIAPFPGAATGTGGRIRDIQAVGRGGCIIAGTAGYCFGNLRLPNYSLEWELEPDFKYPHNFASASEIAIEASNGASDYGNKFGEPVIQGFCRSFGMKTPCGEWREWIKPIMFSGGVGQLSSLHVKKSEPTCNQLILKIGGPIYRIGVGGGAASSVHIQGDYSRDNELDISAVQRGDAQMENKMNRVIRGCIDLGDLNPIKSIHDQGAGGNGNVLKELVNPLGAIIEASKFTLGDQTISILELWGAEYQESNGVLIDEKDLNIFVKICNRERCSVDVVGRITADECFRLKDFENGDNSEYPVNFDLKVVSSNIPQKKFNLNHVKKVLSPLRLPINLRVEECLARVLRLPSVGSKRFLTNKVDRSVGGLVAQQQCVGSLHTPLSDVAVIGLSYWDIVGSAISIGEQPIKMLLDPKQGAKMSVMEALTNMCMAPVSSLEDIKVSGNWMWPAKMPGEGAELWDACTAFCELLKELNIAIDGGKDSLSMAATVTRTTSVKSPGSLVVSAYVCCPDIRRVVTPYLKGNGTLIWIRLTDQCRIGGTALAQAFCQLGDCCPDFEDVSIFKRSWKCLQYLFLNNMVSAAHDISDGGVIGCILEMAFAGNIGCTIDIKMSKDELKRNNCSDIEQEISILFNEEIGWIIEVLHKNFNNVIHEFNLNKMNFLIIGQSCERYQRSPTFSLSVNHSPIFENHKLGDLRMMWEDTSYQLEKLQCDPGCVEKEYAYYKDPAITCCPFFFNSSDSFHPQAAINNNTIRVAIVREEGSNGDKEMAAAFLRAGFEVWDVAMEDLLMESVTLERFRGVAFVGGFSFGDVLGSAKGWAASIHFNEKIRRQFNNFKTRTDTFSLGVCNGCQLMSWLGWLTDTKDEELSMKRDIILTTNDSNRFESRFSTVLIPPNTQSIMLSKLKGARLGVWVAHGEGKFVFSEKDFLSNLSNSNQIALEYVNSHLNSDFPVNYPFNPNGSIGNIAGICSKDGRHLAVMPHPERTVLWWQWAYTGDLDVSTNVSPWFSMFTSALEWCESC